MHFSVESRCQSYRWIELCIQLYCLVWVQTRKTSSSLWLPFRSHWLDKCYPSSETSWTFQHGNTLELPPKESLRPIDWRTDWPTDRMGEIFLSELTVITSFSYSSLVEKGKSKHGLEMHWWTSGHRQSRKQENAAFQINQNKVTWLGGTPI